MSMFTQTIIGAGVITAALSTMISLALPPPPAIEVHRLAFDGHTVTQDRTVTGQGSAFHMAWAASVFDAEGRAVPHCSGSGAHAYAIGRQEVEMTLPRWTGADGCTPESLTPGAYTLRATWSWGDNQASAESAPFEVLE